MGHADEKMRDIASGPGGDAARAALPVADAEKAWQKMQRTFEELVDMARLSPEPLPVILVGGGAILLGDFSHVHMVPPPPWLCHASLQRDEKDTCPACLSCTIYTRNDHFAKTGSGQTLGKHWLAVAGWLAGCLLAMPACYLTLRCMH
jgi:hypothetical protein